LRRDLGGGDCDIDIGALGHARDLGGNRGVYRHAHARRVAAQMCEQGYQDRVLRIVRCDDAPGQFGPGRIERRLRAEHALDAAQGLAQWRQQFEAARGRPHAARARRQQRIGKQMAQLAEAHAHGRLAQMQPSRHMGDIAGGEQGFKGHQQLEINAADITHGYACY
jgi:hypothetical protein